jgi:hypothetical protein
VRQWRQDPAWSSRWGASSFDSWVKRSARVRQFSQRTGSVGGVVERRLTGEIDGGGDVLCFGEKGGGTGNNDWLDPLLTGGTASGGVETTPQPRLITSDDVVWRRMARASWHSR